MCISPCMMPDQGLVPCRKCWQCRANRENDFVGRCIAEQKTSDQTLFVTLTYRGDVPEASYLNYPDIQKFLKRLRRNAPGRKVRYIVVGEYGSKKGRAHWHIILFIKGVKIPMARHLQDRRPSEAILNRRIDWKPWPAGLSYFQESDFKSFKYAVKYALKDMDCQVQRTHLSMSKKPPLGTEFFTQLADAHVKQGIAPQTANYQFRDIIHKGKYLSFQLRGRAKELYFDAYRALWSISRGGPYPISDILEQREDQLVKPDDWSLLAKIENQRVKNPIIERLVPQEIKLGSGREQAVKIWFDPRTNARIQLMNGGNVIITGRKQTWLVDPEKDANFVETIDKILSQIEVPPSLELKSARAKHIRTSTNRNP